MSLHSTRNRSKETSINAQSGLSLELFLVIQLRLPGAPSANRILLVVSRSLSWNFDPHSRAFLSMAFRIQIVCSVFVLTSRLLLDR